MPGRSSVAGDAVAEAVLAEELGLSAVWIAEKYDVKDLPSLAGAIAASTTSIGIGTAVTHPAVRHPMVLASMGQTLQSLSGGRFRIGFGRATPQKWRDYGIAVPTMRTFSDLATLLRQLWAGETVSYEGPLGSFPRLRLETHLEAAPPRQLLAAVGPRMLALSGAHFDGVILHPFLTPEAVRASAAAARRSREEAGRDPDDFLVVAAVVVAVDADEQEHARIVSGRALRYLRSPGLGESISAVNSWDPAPLAAMRERGASRDPAAVVPRAWMDSSAAAGSLAVVRDRLETYLDAGVDEIILHGSTARELERAEFRTVAL